MSETQDNKLDMWMLVEVMGRVRIAGHVTEQTLAGAGFFRIDVPATSKRDGFTRYYSAGAIHSMTPISEELARLMAERIDTEPVSEWQLKQTMISLGLLPEPAREDGWPDNDIEF